MTFPVEPSQVARFEKNNNISIDIYNLHNEKISALHKTVERKPKHVDLLLIRTLKDFHYVCIKDLPKLLKSLMGLPRSYSEKNKLAEPENSSEIVDKYRDIIYQKRKKLKLEGSVQTSRRMIDYYSVHQHNDSEKSTMDSSTQTMDKVQKVIQQRSEQLDKIDYGNWEDPNQLVDRLRILIAELLTGNYIHINEISMIIKELRRANYIY